MASRIFRAVIMGAPGSGKGTIAKRIVKDFDLKFMSSGDILRHQIQMKTEIGKECEKYIKSGSLVPDNILDQAVLQQLKNIPQESWLLDGYPRNLNQAEALYNEPTIPSVVIELDVPFKVIIDRLKDRWIHAPSGRIYNLQFNKPKIEGKDDITGEPLTQRIDDRPETVLARLEEYRVLTLPVSEFFQKKNKLVQFRGTESNAIWPNVQKYLELLRTPVSRTEYK